MKRQAAKAYNSIRCVKADSAGTNQPSTWNINALTYDVLGQPSQFGTALQAGYRTDGKRAMTAVDAVETYYLYDGDSLLAEMGSTGTLQSVNLWGLQGLVGRYKPTSGDAIYYLGDPQGNVSLRVDGTRAVQSVDLYDAYGTLTSAATGNQYGYKGMVGY